MEACSYCGNKKYHDRNKDYWECGSKVDAADNYERSTRCRLKERDDLKAKIAELEAQLLLCPP